MENQFVDSYDPTIENTFQKQLKHNGQVYDLMIVDTAGQDEYSIFPQVREARTWPVRRHIFPTPAAHCPGLIFPRLLSLPQSYCMDIHAYIFVYSINNAKSYEVIKVIHDKLMDLVGQVQVPMVLVGKVETEVC